VSVGANAEVSHAANNVMRKVKKHVSGKDVWQMCDQGPLCREGTPWMISGVLAVALSWMRVRIRRPIIQVPVPQVHNQMTEIKGLPLQQPFFEHM